MSDVGVWPGGLPEYAGEELLASDSASALHQATHQAAFMLRISSPTARSVQFFLHPDGTKVRIHTEEDGLAVVFERVIADGKWSLTFISGDSGPVDYSRRYHSVIEPKSILEFAVDHAAAYRMARTRITGHIARVAH